MKEINLPLIIKSVGYEELDEGRRRLVDRAKEMAVASYAPYSKFHVGAAIEMANGEIAVGSNQENVAYPSGLCAERTACFHAGAVYPGVGMRRIAIAACQEGESGPEFLEHPISPCGACRQSLVEYETLYGPIEVILYGREEIYILDSVRSLLPLSFTEF